MFALADATLLRPLPYPAGRSPGDDLGAHIRPVPARRRVAVADLRDWEEQNRTFEALAAIAFGASAAARSSRRPTARCRAPTGRRSPLASSMCSASRPSRAGRSCLPMPQQGAPPVVVMGEGLWRTTVRRRSLPRRTRGSSERRAIHRHRDRAATTCSSQRPARSGRCSRHSPPNLPRGVRFLQVIGRLKAGVTLDAAQADLAVVADRLAQAYPETNKDWSVLVEPLRTGVMGRDAADSRRSSCSVSSASCCCCAARTSPICCWRAAAPAARELAVRSALGAGRSRIVAQLLTESLVLAALGGVLGAAIGAAILKVAPTLIPAGLLPAAATIAFDGRVVMFCAAAALAVGVLFGLVPAWQATRTSLVQAISSDSRSATRRGGRFRSVLVAGEVAAAVLLLCGAGLLLRTLLVLGSFDTGYRADGDSVLTLDFSLPTGRARALAIRTASR